MEEFKEALPHLQNHPIFSGAKSVGMISGENPRWMTKLPYHKQEAIQKYGHQMLGQDLKNMGLQHESTEGKYGTPERSYVVYGPSKQQMVDLATKYGQDSALHIPAGHKTAAIHYSDLAQDEQGNSLKGHYRPTTGSYQYSATEKPEDYYTAIPGGKGYLNLGFDWDKPPISSEPNKDITKAEIKDLLLAALRKAMKT